MFPFAATDVTGSLLDGKSMLMYKQDQPFALKLQRVLKQNKYPLFVPITKVSADGLTSRMQTAL